MSWQEFENESTEDLMEYIKWKDDSELAETAKDAFRAFCFRFQQDVTHKCRVIACNWGYDERVGDIIAERTFSRFWLYGNFDRKKSRAKELDTGVKLYLYRIASRELSSYKKEQSPDFNPYVGDEEIIREFPNLESFSIEKRGELKRIQEIIEKALARLTPKHKVIYLTYKAHQLEGHSMPRDLLKKLREELDLAQTSIQVYKKEAYDTVDEYLKIYGSR